MAASDLISAVSAVSTKNFMPRTLSAAASGHQTHLRADHRTWAVSTESKPRAECAVLLAYPFPGPFDYRVPAELTVQPGDVVLVPLNRREEVGVVGPRDSARGRPGAGRGQAACRAACRTATRTAITAVACRNASSSR